MRRLADLAKKPSRVVLGLMSGTSHDGVDAVIARIAGCGARSRVEFVHHAFRPYPAKLSAAIRLAFSGDTAHICGLNFELGAFFADCALGALVAAGLGRPELDLVGSHGQTIYHRPPRGRAGGSTLQIGEGSVIAARTGAVTVSDFRTADMAVGGHGAPLVPYADWILFRRPGGATAIQNIGGMANVTVVTPIADDVLGFDTGPGNALIDEAVRVVSGGKKKYDKDGRMAAGGRLNAKLLSNMLSNPYFGKKPPKSTGRELFGPDMAARIIKENSGLRPADIVCTLTHLTARSIKDAYERFVFPKARPDKLVVCGGGAKNRFLTSLIAEQFQGIRVTGPEELGIPAQAREALCFAALANETLFGLPGSLPGVTGASRPSVLGKISL